VEFLIIQILLTVFGARVTSLVAVRVVDVIVKNNARTASAVDFRLPAFCILVLSLSYS